MQANGGEVGGFKYRHKSEKSYVRRKTVRHCNGNQFLMEYQWRVKRHPYGDVDIRMESEIFEEAYKEIYCSKCGTYIGKINLNGRMYGLRCPHCGGNVDTTPPGNNHFGIRESKC